MPTAQPWASDDAPRRPAGKPKLEQVPADSSLAVGLREPSSYRGIQTWTIWAVNVVRKPAEAVPNQSATLPVEVPGGT